MAVPFNSGGSGGAKPQKRARQTTISARPQPSRPQPVASRPIATPTSSGTYKAPARQFGGPATNRMPVPDVPRPSQGGGGPKPPKKGNKPGPIGNYGPGKGGSSDPRPKGKGGGKGKGKGYNSPGDWWQQNKGNFTGPNSPGGPAQPAVPDIEAFLGSDQGYQGGLAELMRALQQFQAQNTSQRGMIESSFQTALERMAGERTNALKNLEADFASRGLLNSGLYGEAIDDYDTEYQSRLGDLNTNQQNELNFLGGQLSEYTGNIEAEKARLRQEAIARRAAQFNLF